MLVPQRKELDKVNAAAGKVEEAIRVLQEKIMEVGGVRLRTQKARVDSLTEEIESSNEKATRLQVQQKTSAKAAAKARDTVTKLEAELSSITEQLATTQRKIEEKTAVAAQLQQTYEKAEATLEAKRESLASLKAAFEDTKARLQSARGVEVELQQQLEDDKRVLDEHTKKVQHWSVKKSALSLQDYSSSGGRVEEPLRDYTPEELAKMDGDKLKTQATIMEEKLKETKPNLTVIQHYAQVESDYLARVGELDAMTARRDEAKGAYDGLRKQRLERFMEGFSLITQKLKEMYQMITLGGNAELELVDSLDPFSEGIMFSVMPPKKSWKNIANLSGGEKTLSSLALVFALHHYKPTPLYIMDEIDAALDFRNVSIIANYIKERTQNAQFIIISLRNNMFELADRLVGIYKTESCTKSVTINPEKMAVVLQDRH